MLPSQSSPWLHSGPHFSCSLPGMGGTHMERLHLKTADLCHCHRHHSHWSLTTEDTKQLKHVLIASLTTLLCCSLVPPSASCTAQSTSKVVLEAAGAQLHLQHKHLIALSLKPESSGVHYTSLTPHLLSSFISKETNQNGSFDNTK